MSRDQIHWNFPKLSTSPEGSWMWVSPIHWGTSLNCPTAPVKCHIYQDTMLNLGFSELGTVQSFQVIPREAETILWYKIPQASCMPQPEIAGPLSLLLLHWVWWELSLSYSFHLLYTQEYWLEVESARSRWSKGESWAKIRSHLKSSFARFY